MEPPFDETALINLLLSDKGQDILRINNETLQFKRYTLLNNSLNL